MKHIERLFIGVTVAVLAATSLFWSVLSARLQNGNADNLIDGYLFESWRVFHAASFPGAHTFLLKWPLFLISSFFGNTLSVTTILAVLCCLAPIALIVFLLYKIERRPLIFGVWCLALSSILLLVPAQPSPGALLPVNTAMLTTRNLEYAVFIAMLLLLVRTRRWRDWRLACAAVLGTVLIASDKLFVPLLLLAVLGAAGLAILRKPKAIVWLRWVIVSMASIAAAYGLLIALAASNITGIVGQTTTSPYGFALNLHTIVTAVGYGGISLLTLFGANPAYYQLQLTSWPHDVVARVPHVSSVGYVFNAVAFLTIIVLASMFVVHYVRAKTQPKTTTTVTMMLLFASLAAAGIYVITNHYYPADSRYLTIAFLALVLAAGQTLSQQKISRRVSLGLLLLCAVVLPFSIVASKQQYVQSRDAGSAQRSFNVAAAQQLNAYHVDVVIGDYWDIVPVRSLLPYKPAIVPLGSCASPNKALSSSAWQQASRTASVGYIINSAPQPTGFKRCSAQQIVAAFGEPTRRLPISAAGHEGSQLFVYDQPLKKVVVKKAPSPIRASALGTDPTCLKGSLLTVVAHEDDDLLFMNPDLQTAIDSGECVTTVFLTAGDAGNDGKYPLGRMQGSQAAYASMYSKPNQWTKQPKTVGGNLVTSYTLNNVPQVRLLFYDLPDGNVKGQGFVAHHYESLAQLRSGKISSIVSNDGRSAYSRTQLINSLTVLMDTLQPNVVHTQDYNTSLKDGDHSDHHAAGYFAKQAFKQYSGSGSLLSYSGYPGHLLPTNVSGDQLAAKKRVFFTYGQHDPGVCDNDAACITTSYADYLPRQYSKLYAQRAISSYRTHTGISSVHTPRTVLIQNGQGGCVTSNEPQSLYCTSGR